MAFPFLAPLKDWIETALKERESNPTSVHTLSPFAILSSAAVVSKGDTPASIKDMIADDNVSGIYNGCVVTNTIETSKLYQTGNTIVGYDLDGKEIKVEGEKNRRVSVPIITKIDIDTDGGNNTLKTAKVDIKVFTLKQLEMFELFFLRPSMNVVLEYGWNTDIRSNSHLIDSYLFAKKKHSDYIKKYLEIFSHKENAYKDAKVKYLDTLKKTKGCYDFFAGKVTNFTYSPDTDGTYNINLEISAGNELQLWMPIKQANPTNTNQNQSTDAAIDAYDTFLNKLAADLNYPDLKNVIPKRDWEKEFFNWGISNEKQKDTKYSKEAYISFKLILHILNQPTLFKIKPKTIQSAFFEDAGLTKEIIPIHSHSNIISTTDLFILPGDLPKIEVSEIGKKNIIRVAGKYDAKTKKFTADPLVDAKINGKSFNLNLSEIFSDSSREEDGKLKPIPITNGRIGNLLNVFFRYDSFVQAFNQSYTQADILNNILQSMNDNMFGLCSLQFQKDSDLNDGSPLTIIDKKLPIKQPDVDIQKIYRFKIGAANSIVKAFEFNMELSTLMQAQALYSSQLALNKAINKDDGPDTDSVAQRDDFSSADLSYATNADGYYSINSIEVKLVKEAQAWNKYIATTTNTTNESTSTDKPKTAAEVKKEMTEVLESKYVKFKSNIKDKNSATNNMIYLDSSLILKHVKDTPEKSTALTYLDVSFTMDGIAGISCGEYFHIDGIPEVYNKNGYFQVTNVKHSIDDKGWETKIEAGYRIKSETQIFKDV
jgi:hypothetical protein